MTEERRKPGRRPTGRGTLPNVLTLRGKPEWRDWLNDFADEQGITTAELVDRSLALMAKQAKHAQAPPRV